MKYGEIVYYSDELNDEISDFKITPITIDKNYKYISNNIFYKIFSFITYRILATPIMWCYFKIFKRISYKNTKILKQHKKDAIFIYGNHTNLLSDGISPALIFKTKKPHLICNADNVSMPFWKHFTKMWGALPLPDTLDATKNFNKAIEHNINKKNPIVIYPEAHLWPYYTKIRPFSHLSFRYPVKYNKPVYSFTTVYTKRKITKKPKLTIYVDGPFYPDTSIPPKEAQQKLRNEVYNKMVERSKLSDYEYVTYQKKEN